MLTAIAWIVAAGVLDFKLAVSRAKPDRGDFHDKFRSLRMLRRTMSASTSLITTVSKEREFRVVKGFLFWEAAFAPLVAGDSARFQRLWEKHDPNVKV